MSDTPARSVPAEPARCRPPRPGQRSILLSTASGNDPNLLLAFTPTQGGIAFWRSTAPEKSPLECVATFSGRFGVHAVTRLLASGAAGPAVEGTDIGDAWVDGVAPDQVDLVKLAWWRVNGRVDPRAAAVLALSPKTLERAREYVDATDAHDLLELGQRILDADRAWVEDHRAEVDAEVDRRAAGAGAGEPSRRAIRAFVEECLLRIGRLPRPDETPEAWDGAGIAGRDLDLRTQRRLGIHQTGRAGKFHVWVHYWDGAGALGRGDFGSGAGWYWDVTNPDPGWIVDGIMGPCDSADAAWSDAACLAEQE